MSIYIRAIDQMTNHTAADLRAFLADLVSGAGILDVSGGHLLVTENGTPNMSVNVAPGIAYVLNSAWTEFASTQRFWDVLVDTTVNVAISSNPSGSTRIDLICLKVNTGVTPDANASNVATVISVEGTPGAGSPAVPNDHLLLATITVANGETTIDTVDIVDGRVGFSLEMGNINLKNTDSQIQVNDLDPWRTITLTPGFLKPTTTGGCADPETIEAGTNDIDYDVLDFDTTTAERLFANLKMPDSWDGGVIQFRYDWTSSGGGSAQTVKFDLSGRSLANDEAIDQAVGTAVGVTDTWIADGDIHTSAWSGDVTLAGTPSGGEYIHLELERDTTTDTLAVDARLISLQLRYKQAQFSD